MGDAHRTQRRIEKRFMSRLRELVCDVERKIRRGKERISLPDTPGPNIPPHLQAQMEQKKKAKETRVQNHICFCVFVCVFFLFFCFFYVCDCGFA